MKIMLSFSSGQNTLALPDKVINPSRLADNNMYFKQSKSGFDDKVLERVLR
jgi:hypothetical protein